MARFKFTAMAYSRIQNTILLSLLTVGLVACSTSGSWSKEPRPDYGLIAENLVDSLVQFPHLNPQEATLQLAPPRTRFAREVEGELRDRGYKVQRVRVQSGPNAVRSEVRQLKAGDEGPNLYIVSVEKLSIERQYGVLDAKTVPLSEQVIRGAEERNITLDDGIFGMADSEYSQVSYASYEGPAIVEALAGSAAGAHALDSSKPVQASAVKWNMSDVMASNYSDVFSGYEDIEKSVLVFPNDSLKLGDVNKGIIESFVADMNPETDVLSVVGCSHGSTDINNGNSLLALGRANRVKEALLFAGLKHDRILDEGCWSPSLVDAPMPRRGVVLTLKRQKSS